MKNSAIVVLVVCGTACILVPWVYSAHYAQLAADLLGQAHITKVSLHNEAATAYKWWTMLIGIVMVATGVWGGLRGQRSRAPARPAGRNRPAPRPKPQT